MIRAFLSLILLVCMVSTSAQKPAGQRHVEHGMATLGMWSLHNLASGSIGWATMDGSQKYYHQMNALWNTVNLGLAISGLVGSVDDGEWDHEKSKKAERLFLVNAGLDVIYMGAGVVLWSRSSSNGKYSDQQKGYGQTLLLQGGFLFAFDLAMYALLRKERTTNRVQLSSSESGLGLSVHF